MTIRIPILIIMLALFCTRLSAQENEGADLNSLLEEAYEDGRKNQPESEPAKPQNIWETLDREIPAQPQSIWEELDRTVPAAGQSNVWNEPTVIEDLDWGEENFSEPAEYGDFFDNEELQIPGLPEAPPEADTEIEFDLSSLPEAADNSDPLEGWTLFGKDPTADDYRAIEDNIRRLMLLDAISGTFQRQSGGPVNYRPRVWHIDELDDFDPDTDGTVIADFFPYSQFGSGAYSGYQSVSYRSWPFHRDGGNLYYTYPGGNSTWYSAPYPWVVHLRAPTIRLYSPSPYYVTPWVSAPPSYFFNPSRTAFNIDWDSDAGKSWDVNLFRGWGKVSARGGDAKKDHSGGRHHSKVTVSYNASTPTYGNVYIHPNYGSVPYSLIPLIEGFRSTRHYPSTGNGAMLRYSSLINGGSRAYPRYSGYSGTGYVTRHPSGAYIIQSRR